MPRRFLSGPENIVLLLSTPYVANWLRSTAAKHFSEVCALSLKNFSSRSGRDAAPEKREIRETPIPLVCEYLGEQLQSQQTEAWSQRFQIMPFADGLRIARSFGKLAQSLCSRTRQPIRSIRPEQLSEYNEDFKLDFSGLRYHRL